MYRDLHTYKSAILETTKIAALQVLKLQNPAFDEVKYKEACLIAGSERWLKEHIKQGHIKRIRRGKAVNSPIYYSRLEIAAVKEAEAQLKYYTEEYREEQAQAKRLQDDLKKAEFEALKERTSERPASRKKSRIKIV